jgi:hypothetical protein
MKTVFQDEYLAISTMFLGLAGSSFLLPVGWGGGRPMMIAFTFVGVFAPLGLLIPVRWCVQSIKSYLDSIDFFRLNADTAAKSGFAVVLALFLVVNTGVAAGTVIGGSAPMNIPLQSEFDEKENPNFRAKAYVDTDVQTHAWLLDHRSTRYGVQGDLIANGQTDKYRSSIALAMETDVVFPYSAVKPRGFSNRPGETNKTEYVLLLGHNLNLDVYTLNSTYERRSIDSIRRDLPAWSRIYSTGDSVIYFGGNQTAVRGR